MRKVKVQTVQIEVLLDVCTGFLAQIEKKFGELLGDVIRLDKLKNEEESNFQPSMPSEKCNQNNSLVEGTQLSCHIRLMNLMGLMGPSPLILQKK